ncbi:MAG: hypothetical protein NZR01_14885 [Bryobacteraceae bacterium]|nr:hypothetical protein [Bryobacteraceae bacterium]
MHRLSHATLRSLVISAAMGALALALPAAFHAVGLGSRFLPMLLPLLVNGYLSRWPWAAATGLLIPWISALATGMPPLYPPVAAIMSLEGFVLASAAAATRRLPLPVSVPMAVLAGRAAALAGAWTAAAWLDLPPAFASLAMILQGLPGVVLQLLVTPVAVAALRRRGGLLFDETRLV